MTETDVPTPSTAPRAYLYRKHLEQAWYDAFKNLTAGLHRARLLENPHIGFERTPVGRLVTSLRDAHMNLRTYHKGRINRLEGTLRRTLSHEAKSEPERATILKAVYGRTGRSRDASVLNEAEGQMIDDYRLMDEAGRQMIRTLFARLAMSSQKTPAKKGSR